MATCFIIVFCGPITMAQVSSSTQTIPPTEITYLPFSTLHAAVKKKPFLNGTTSEWTI